MKVLVSDPLSPMGIQLFEETPGIDVDVQTGLTPEALMNIIGDYDGLVIRSNTRVTSDILTSAHNLRIIGRAGIGLDNVDIPEASRRGVVVMNTPEGNTITAAEHTIAMMMAISRNIPQATASLKAGRWEKATFKGRELFNKTLGLIGAGHIGRIVADRARGMKMKVIVYDPYIKPEAIEKLDLEPVSLDELLARADYVTLHTPKTEETINLINREAISKMKKDAILINCARGGIVNEEDVFEALKSGGLAGAAFDVFTTEPPGKSRLISLNNFICTPHLGASTREAQDNVAKEVAEQVIAYLLHGSVKNAVNVPSISAELMSVLRPYAILLERMGSLQAQLSDSALVEVKIDYSGAITRYDSKPLTTAMLKGLLTPILKYDVNFVNAPYVAADRGIKVIESKTDTSDDFASLVKLTVRTLEDEHIVSGTIFGKKLIRILRINNFYLEAIPEGHNLLIQNENVPGVIGAIASTLGQSGININRMQVGEEKEHRENVIFLSVNEMVNDDIIVKMKNLKHIISVRRINL
ncbi:MAG: phosphoglycerate dehydrogenase [Deltaproteobacteria bacterium]|nr:phosphoglycerate dehydrogenase [Deltaproteobacteria bacterium]